MMLVHNPNHLHHRLDHMLGLLQDIHHAQLRKRSLSDWEVSREVLLTTLLGGVVGYFLFKVMDYHFGDLPIFQRKGRSRKK